MKRIVIILLGGFLLVGAAVVLSSWQSVPGRHEPEAAVKPVPPVQNESKNWADQQPRDKPAVALSLDTSLAALSEPGTRLSKADYERRSSFGPMPSSLRGTEIDGVAQVDARGRLMVSRDLRHLFDYFLSAQLEDGPELTIARIEEYLQLALPSSAAAQAQSILHAYLDYRSNLKAFEPRSDPYTQKDGFLAELEHSVQERTELRRKFMPPEVVEAFFGREEAYDRFTLRRLGIENDPSLSNPEKMSRIATLEETVLPDTMKERRRRFEAEQKLAIRIAELQLQPGTDEEVHRLRTGFYGEAAADRLSVLDRKRADFSERMEDYERARQEIMDSVELTDADKQSRLITLRDEYFSEGERVEFNIRQHKEQRSQ